MKQIPFPAFTICMDENLTTADVNVKVKWLESFDSPVFLTATELGKCRTVNFCDPKLFFEPMVDDEQFFEYIDFDDETDEEWKFYGTFPENQTTPYSTSQLELGFETTVYSGFNNKESNKKGGNSFILMIHSPFEPPTKETNKFFFGVASYDTFFVTPQLTTIDDTMIGMEPKK